MEKCPPNPFVVMDDLCQYEDEQWLKLQELPEDVPVGEMPRSIDLNVTNYLTNLCTPGTRLTAIGTFSATETSIGAKMAGRGQKGTNTVKYSYLQVLGVQVVQGNTLGQSSGPLTLSGEEEEQFEHMAKDQQIRDKIFKSIAPAICASEKDVLGDVKKA